MTETTDPSMVTDEGILIAIHDFVRSYDPLNAAKEHLHFEVLDGVVRVTGHVQGARQKRVLLDNLPDLPGVVAVDDTGLYDDDTILYNVGMLLPRGVRARVSYGDVYLIGTAPTDVNKLIMDVSKVPGVLEVKNGLR
ncbi:MAG: BON domain-containing protein [Chloroflexi bacterium]|nr:BON domain-containing protein [Chloroflexota bacterium]